ncbi:MAG TPA: 3-oxoadipate enol-lactonase [Solirubrobacteraceae bacterium]|nr:3-oxoadipate enol-lactonase [Solirubrobacteraceae bacterium]
MAVALHHEISGPADAPALVLAGSLGTDLGMWEPLLEHLGGEHRMIRVDHRGHGASPAPPGPYTIPELADDLCALLDRLELERPSVCGLSIGGMIGMWLAAHRPDRLDRLVLICTAAHLPPAADWRKRAAVVRARGVGSIAPYVLAAWLTPAYAGTHPLETETLSAMLTSTSPEGYAACCEAIAEVDVREELVAITAPTLVIAGDQDQATPPDPHARLIADAIPDARLELLSAAHLASFERPAEAGALIRRHLA